MMSGPHQTKAGLTLSQPQYNDSARHFKNGMNHSKIESTVSKGNGNQHHANR